MEKIAKTFLVEPCLAGSRLDKFLVVCLDGDYSRQKIQDYIKRGDVTIDGEMQTAAKFPVAAGSTVVIRVPVLSRRLEGAEVDFEVVYQDRNMAIVNKPAGLVVHPETASGLPHEGAPTLAHGLVKRFPELEGEDSLRPGIVHRLDNDTSGLLVVGLSEEGRNFLKDLFAERCIHKEYLALVHGVPEEPTGEIDLPIGRHPTKKISMAVVDDGKEALTRYRVVYASEDARFSVLAVTIITGRTHQIRVHLSAVGHPIIGDMLYTMKDRLADESLATPLAALKEKQNRHIQEAHANKPLPPAGRQMLHAWRLAFPYGAEGETDKSSPPEKNAGLDAHDVLGTRDTPELYDKTDTIDEPDNVENIDTGGAAGNPGQSAEFFGQSGKEVARVEWMDGLLVVTCPPPPDFMEMLEKLLHDPLRVVVTGMPGSGKSSFTRFLEEFGVPSFSADACVRELYGPDGDGTRVLRMRFGDAYVTGHGVNKQTLGAAMRESDSLRREIEDMIHPLVYHALEVFWRDNFASPLAVAEIPLFFESGPRTVDVTIGVACPFALRAKRLRETRGWSEEVITAMEAWQLPEEEKMARCDVVVSNTGDLPALRHEAEKLYAMLRDQYGERIQERLRGITLAWEGLSEELFEELSEGSSLMP